jgi:hypothetical protein
MTRIQRGRRAAAETGAPLQGAGSAQAAAPADDPAPAEAVVTAQQ